METEPDGAANRPSDSTSAAGPTLLGRLSGWQIAAAIALLAWYYVSALTAVSTKSATADEAYHLASGYSYWKFQDFRMQPENGNLPQRWAALPLLLGDYEFPSLDQEAWRRAQMDLIGNLFVYADGNENVLMIGRAMIGLLGVALGALVFAWTLRLLGAAAAFTSLTVYAFCPTVLNNGTWVTSDMAAALFFMASMAALWIVLQRLNWKTLLLSSLVMGGLFVAKFSGVLIVPMGLLLVAVQLASRQPLVVSWRRQTWHVHSRLKRLAADGALIVVHGVVVWCVIWSFYNFRYDMFGVTQTGIDATGQTVLLDTPHFPWSYMLKPERGLIDRAVLKARELHFLPEAYLYGFIHSYNYAQERRAFLNGQFSKTGFPAFFPYCLAVKTPLTMFVLMGLGSAALWLGWRGPSGSARQEFWRRMRAGLYRAAPLWSLFVVYWAFAITSHLNIGHRHILPTYPPMIMLAGSSALWLARLPRFSIAGRASTAWRYPAAATVVLGTVGLFAVESLSSWPNYLAYFNQLIGGPRYAYRHLIDASLDWGQETIALKKWLDQKGLDNSPGKKVYLAYFGHASPYYYDIHFETLPSVPGFTPPSTPKALGEGTYCISATLVQSLYTPFIGPWRLEYEEEYRKLWLELQEFYRIANDPQARQQWIVAKGGEAQAIKWFARFEQARFGRLCAYLRQREPDEQINYAILIYRLSKDDLQRALFGPARDLIEVRSR